ncbi:MAG TPA: SDR family oxidoreductase [Gemmataceae bacterium]|jgi:pteridine reductase|nr:SDR family oxidoreductase [Gemmataceae bacterium]
MNPRKVALVTGSGKKRVGWYVADALAERHYSLVLHYRTSITQAAESAKAFEQRGVEVLSLQADLSDEQSVQGMVEKIISRFGRLDVLVNCAAIWQRKPLEQVTASDVRQHFEINILGTFLCCQHAGLAMAKQAEGGLIVSIGDWAEVRPYRDYAAYFASKGAIGALTRCFAVELAARNPKVRVNCILPGPVMLPPDLPMAEKQHAIEATLVKREGSPRNIAQAVLSFLDNDFITGTCLPVDGGRTIFAPD